VWEWHVRHAMWSMQTTVMGARWCELACWSWGCTNTDDGLVTRRIPRTFQLWKPCRAV